MGLGFRVSSGVRVYPSSRGISVGKGRVRYFQRLGGGGSQRTSATAYQRQVRDAQRAEEINQLLALDQQLTAQCNVHREEFGPAERVEIPPPNPVDEGEIRNRLTAEAVADIPRLKVGERRAVRQAALSRLDSEVRAETERRAAKGREEQRAAAEAWQRLQANDPEAVLGALEAAFADNEAPAAAVSCRGDRIDVVMRWPELEDVVPEGKPAVTPTGRPTIHKRTKTQRADLYLQTLASHALVTVKEALAVCPGIIEVGIAVVRVRQDLARGDQIAEPVLLATLRREQLASVRWDKIVSTATLLELATGRIGIRGKGASRELFGLDLTGDEEERDFIETVAGGLEARVPDGGVPGLSLPVAVAVQVTA
jgi:hypothetical protein